MITAIICNTQKQFKWWLSDVIELGIIKPEEKKNYICVNDIDTAMKIKPDKILRLPLLKSELNFDSQKKYFEIIKHLSKFNIDIISWEVIEEYLIKQRKVWEEINKEI